MLELIKNLGRSSCSVPSENILCLDYDQRTKGRLRARTQGGQEVGLFLERGRLLRCGDVLSSASGTLVKIESAKEQLIEAITDDWLVFSRCCYHLGNRHVPLSISELVLQFRPDHILQEMIESLGMTTTVVYAAFNPEQGAYKGAGHHH